MLKKYLKTDLMHLAICLVFLCTPIESVGVFGEGTSFSLVKLVFIVFIFIWIVKSRKTETNSIMKTVIMLCIYFFVGLVWSIDMENSLIQLATFLLPTIIMCLIISCYLKRREDFRMIAVSFLIGCIIMSYFALTLRAQVLEAAITGEMERVSALGQDANEMSVLLNLGVGILLHYLGMDIRKVFKIIDWTLVAVFSFVIVSTGSRTGTLILACLFSVFLFNNIKRSWYLMPLLLVGVSFILPFIAEGVVERLMGFSESIQSNDLTGRGEIWRNGWRAFLDENVILGVGYSNFSNMLEAHGYVRWASHNTYLSYLTCAGFLGFMIVLRLLVQLIEFIIKTHKIEKKWNMLYYLLPVFIGMMTIETSNRRWLFLLCVVVYNYYFLVKKEHALSQLLRKHPTPF